MYRNVQEQEQTLHMIQNVQGQTLDMIRNVHGQTLHMIRNVQGQTLHMIRNVQGQLCSRTLTHSLRQSNIVDYRAAYFAANKTRSGH